MNKSKNIEPTQETDTKVFSSAQENTTMAKIEQNQGTEVENKLSNGSIKEYEDGTITTPSEKDAARVGIKIAKTNKADEQDYTSSSRMVTSSSGSNSTTDKIQQSNASKFTHSFQE